MPGTSNEQAVFDRFSKRYENAQSEVMRRIERAVCGCDYGATSWTTADEAETVAEWLDLKPGRQLLEVGAGSGWPGVYLAKKTGCDIAMVDLPFVGLRLALERARADAIAGTPFAAVADGAALPFRTSWFDAVLHSDVLCCLREKIEVLKACRRVLRPDGGMVFSVILVTPGLTPEQQAEAAAHGPPFVAAAVPYPEMLDRTGWTIVDHRDLTADYEASVRERLEQLERNEDEVVEVLGAHDVAEEQARRRRTLKALGRGLIRRELFSVVPSKPA